MKNMKQRSGKGFVHSAFGIAGRCVSALLDIVYPESIYCIGCGAIIDKTRPYSLCDTCRTTFHFATGKTCVKCGRILDEDFPHLLCNDCIALGEDEIAYEEGESGSENCDLRSGECASCSALCASGGHVFDRGFTCLMYGLYEKEMVRAFKYHDRPYYAKHLGEMMYDRLEPENLRIDIVVPVPLHPKKLKKRGYNQAELLAREVARRMGVPMVRALVRTKNTRPMSRLTREERLGNLVDIFAVPPQYSGGRELTAKSARGAGRGSAPDAYDENACNMGNSDAHAIDGNRDDTCSTGEHRCNAFSIAGHRDDTRDLFNIAGHRILLIDDIYTTGSTADACAAALKAAGAAAVYVCTLAAGGNPPPRTDD